MPEIEDDIIIEQPVEVVFGYITDLEKLPERIPTVLEAVALSGEEMGVGIQYLMTSQVRGRKTEMIYEVTEYEKDRYYATKVVSGSQPFQERYQVEEDENGTRVTLTAKGEMPGLMKYLSGRFSRLLKKQVGKELEQLKERLEESG